jgi:hypothetical protein
LSAWFQVGVAASLAFSCRAHGLAVDCDNSTREIHGGGEHLNPVQEATFTLCQINTAEYATDSVMRWDAVRKMAARYVTTPG